MDFRTLEDGSGEEQKERSMDFTTLEDGSGEEQKEEVHGLYDYA